MREKAAMAASRPRSTTNGTVRRTPAEIAKIKAAMIALLKAHRPMGVRQIYYRLEMMGLVEKNEKAVKGTVGRLLRKMRRSGEIPLDWIEDSSREPLEPLTFDNPEDAIRWLLQRYREDLWKDQSLHVEVWIEKDGLVGIVEPITMKWGVRLMSTHGNSSLSFLNEAAKHMESKGKPIVLLNFGDEDWSGHNIKDTAVRDVSDWAPIADITVKRIAVTPEQIEEWGLPTRPPKTTDVRAKDWEGDCVELDAIEPHVLSELVENAIKEHIDWDAWAESERREKANYRRLTRMIGRRKGNQ
jgi:hypothetical protein